MVVRSASGEVIGISGTVVALLLLAAAASASLPRSTPLKPLSPGHRVFLLYDSREGSTRAENPLSGLVADGVARMGFEPVWHDIATGLPSPASLAGARAVVTGLRGSAMKGAAEYPGFVASVIRAGIRFVIIGSYGAYQEKGGDFLPAGTVNHAFEALGVRYEAAWTDDPARFSTSVHDPRIGKPEALAAQVVRHFYQFTPVRPDVRVLVGARRTDAGQSARESSVVFASATGAMALSRYLSKEDCPRDRSALRIDLAAFLSLALGRAPADPATLMVIHDPSSADSRRAAASLAAASSYSGIPMAGVTLGDAHALRPDDLSAYAGLVLAVPEVPAPADRLMAGLIQDLLGRGGRVLSVLPLRNPLLARVFGNLADAPIGPARSASIAFEARAFPGVGGVTAEMPDASFTGFATRLGPACRALARGGGSVLWWECAEGRGRTFSLNAFEMTERPALGIVTQAVLDVEGAWAMPVLSTAVEFVDDCPLPVTGAVIPALGKSDADFYSGDFLGMMDEARSRFSIRPLYLAVFSYEDRLVPPFGDPFAGTSRVVPLAMARRLVESDQALGLHGMNHVSPALAGGVTKPFPDEAALREFFAAGGAALGEIGGPGVRASVYVPPNDWIDQAGKRALVTALPDVRVISSVFSGTSVETEQDFCRDPDFPWVIDFPRTYAGYRLAGDAMLGMLNGVMLLAVSSHFIHPDDILDPERSGGLPWADLRRGYLDGLGRVRVLFPFLRDRGVEDAARDLSAMLDSGFTARRTDDGTIVAARAPGSTSPITVLVSLGRGRRLAEVSGGEATHSHPESGRYFMRMDGRVMSVKGLQGAVP